MTASTTSRTWRTLALSVSPAIAVAIPAPGALAQAPRAPAAVVASGLPFGPWRLPDSLFRAPYTATVLALRPHDAVARLDAARAARLKVFVILERSRRHHQNADKSFSLPTWKSEIARFRGVDFGPYVADGTVLGHKLIDEPHDPSNWSGEPIPYATIDSAAAFSKSLWPTLPAGVSSPPTFLAGARWGYLDWGFAQYRPKKGELRAWLAREVAASRRSGLGLVLSMNVLDGNGTAQPMSAEELRRFGLALAAEPSACALTMWKYDEGDPRYFQQPAVRRAVDAIAHAAAARAAPPCRRR
jgi:hypothetical protein